MIELESITEPKNLEDELHKLKVELKKLKPPTRKEPLILLLSVIGLAIVIIIVIASWCYASWDARASMLAGVAVYASVIVALLVYSENKRIEKYRFGTEKRNQFICDKMFMDIRSRIEHNDAELQTIVAITNVPSPYYFHLLPPHKWELHERFDAYLNWIEGYAILWNNGLIEHTELEGSWTYYTGRLSEATLDSHDLDQYLRNLGYDKDDINAFRQSRKESSNFSYPEDLAEKIRFGKNSKIDPIEKPIWFYVCREGYEFKSLMALIQYCMLSDEISKKTKRIMDVKHQLNTRH